MNHLEKPEPTEKPAYESSLASSQNQGVMRGRVFTAGSVSQSLTIFPENASCKNSPTSRRFQRGRSASLSMSSPATPPVKNGSFRMGSPPSKQQIDLGQKFINGLKPATHSSEESPPSSEKSPPPSPPSPPSSLSSSLGNGSLTRSKKMLKKVSQIFKKDSNLAENFQAIPVASPNEKEVIEDKPAYEKIRLEWISSEEDFNDHLKILVEVKKNIKLQSCNVFECVDDKSLQAVAQEVLAQLLGEIEKLKNFSDIFLAALYDSQEFSKFVQLLAGLHYESFGDPCKFYSIWLKTLKKLSPEERKMILGQLNFLISPEEQIKLGFADHAITLIQRLPKFPLFIQNLIEALEDDPSFQQEVNLLTIAHQNTRFAAGKAEKAIFRSTRLFSPVIPSETPSNL
jgi:hypothetical protein